MAYNPWQNYKMANGICFSYRDMTLCYMVLQNATQSPLWQCHFVFFHLIVPRVLI